MVVMSQEKRLQMEFYAELCYEIYSYITVGVRGIQDLDDFIIRFKEYKAEYLYDNAENQHYAIFLIKDDKLNIIMPTVGKRFASNMVSLIFYMDMFFDTIECSKGIINFTLMRLFEIHNRMKALIIKNNLSSIILSGLSAGGMQSQLLGLFYAMLIDFHKNYYKKDIIVPTKLNTLTKSFYKSLHQQNPIKSIEELMDDDYKVFSKIDIENVFAFGVGAVFTKQDQTLYNQYMVDIQNLENSKLFATYDSKDIFSGAGIPGCPYMFVIDLITFVCNYKWIYRIVPGCIAIVDDELGRNLVYTHIGYHMAIEADKEIILQSSCDSLESISNKNLPHLLYNAFQSGYYQDAFVGSLITSLVDFLYAVFTPIILLCNMFGGQYYLHWYQLGLSGIFYGLLIKIFI